MQIAAGGGINYGIYALVFSVNLSRYWVRYVKLRSKSDLCFAMAESVLVAAFSAAHIQDLFTAW